MIKNFSLINLCLLVSFISFAQTDFVPGANVIFEDRFEQDPEGDLPARWSTSGDGQVVKLGDVEGKWFKITQPTAVNPELKKGLPENYTIEFDLYLKNTSGVAPVIIFGLTPLSDVASNAVYKRNIGVRLHRYNQTGANLVYYKNSIEKLGEKKFNLQGYIGQPLHVSMAVNNTRWRVYLDGQKIIDLPKVLTPDYRRNFFIGSYTVSPSPEEGVYISNVRIAEGDVDARSLLIKQLLEQGSAVTTDIQIDAQSNQITTESQPVVDQVGQVLEQNPDMSIQINTAELLNGNFSAVNKEALKAQADRIKAYLIEKFKVQANRIVTDVKTKATAAIDKNQTASKAKKLITEFIKIQ